MRKKFVKVISAALIMTMLSGCGAEGVPDEGAVSDQKAGDGGSGEDIFAGDPDSAPGSSGEEGDSGTPRPSSGSEPQAYYMDEIYTEEENILPITRQAEAGGISYKIENVEYTENFGDRDQKHLTVFTPGAQADDKGNLSSGYKYLFLEITFTNTTDQTQEIYRTSNGIWVIGESLNTVAWVSDACYYDMDWEKGTESQKHHWVLEAGESVTSEIGWVIESCDSMLAADDALEGRMGSAGPYALYYRTGQSDGNNEGCFFIDLGVKVE